jgi:Secretion system C-terminal sorting domain
MKSLIYATKKLTFLGLFLTFQTTGNAQDYVFTHFNDPYAEFTDGVALSYDTVCSQEFTIPVAIGFSFPYFNFQLDSIDVHTIFLMKEFMDNNVMKGIQIFPFAAGYVCANAGDTEISYKTTGAPGNRIFCVQWKNLALSNDTIGNNHANFQSWFYESDGAIEVRFGNTFINQNDCYFTNEPGGSTALIHYSNPSNPQVSSSSLCLLDSAENPTMAYYSEFLEPSTVIGHPAASKVYRFARADAGISEQLSAAAFTITPNPGNDNILISTESQFDKIAIYSIDGQLVLTTTMDAMSKQLNVQELAKGSYIIELSNNLTRQTQRFIKI